MDKRFSASTRLTLLDYWRPILVIISGWTGATITLFSGHWNDAFALMLAFALILHGVSFLALKRYAPDLHPAWIVLIIGGWLITQQQSSYLHYQNSMIWPTTAYTMIFAGIISGVLMGIGLRSALKTLHWQQAMYIAGGWAVGHIVWALVLINLAPLNNTLLTGILAGGFSGAAAGVLVFRQILQAEQTAILLNELWEHDPYSGKPKPPALYETSYAAPPAFRLTISGILVLMIGFAVILLIVPQPQDRQPNNPTQFTYNVPIPTARYQAVEDYTRTYMVMSPSDTLRLGELVNITGVVWNSNAWKYDYRVKTLDGRIEAVVPEKQISQLGKAKLPVEATAEVLPTELAE